MAHPTVKKGVTKAGGGAVENSSSSSIANSNPYLLCRTRMFGPVKDGFFSYGPFEWYIIDVDKGEVCPAPIPPMPIDVCSGATTKIVSTGGSSSNLNSIIMVIGGRCCCDMANRCPLVGASKRHQWRKLHYLDLGGPRVWESGPVMSTGRVRPELIDFGDGKIYLFGGIAAVPSSSDSPPPLGEVLDIRNLKKKEEEEVDEEKEEELSWGWIPLAGPSDLKRECLSLSQPTVPDPKRRRVLAHFKPLNALYAFYTCDNSWVCIDSLFDFRNWCRYSTVVDDHDVLYSLRPTLTNTQRMNMDDFNQFSSPFELQAYDLVTHTWLNVTWSNPDMFPLRVMYYYSYFFHLGNGRLCILSPIKDKNRTRVLLMIIRVYKTFEGDIVAVKECTKSVEIDGMYNEFITLPQADVEVRRAELEAAGEEVDMTKIFLEINGMSKKQRMVGLGSAATSYISTGSISSRASGSSGHDDVRDQIRIEVSEAIAKLQEELATERTARIEMQSTVSQLSQTVALLTESLRRHGMPPPSPPRSPRSDQS